MVLHSSFKTYDAYFHEVLVFLQSVSWLFDCPVTHLLSEDIFSKVPSEWTTPLLSMTNDELNFFPNGFVKNDWPSSLINFQEQCQRLTLPVLLEGSVNQSYVPNKDIPKEIWRGMTPKKKTEVELLSTLIHEECQSLRISVILDVGSGHGYVDRLLLSHGYKILGIETNLRMINYTVAQLEKLFPNSLKMFKYIQLNINSSSFKSVQEAIKNCLINQSEHETNIHLQNNSQLKCNNLNDRGNDSISKRNDTSSRNNASCNHISENISMIGLHACGDLAVDSIKLFLNLPEIKSLVMVPCCYHKMVTVNNVRNEPKQLSFCNFPLSKTLNNAIVAVNSDLPLQVPFVRLAGQATKSLWQNCSEKDHENHAFNVLARAVVQLYCVQEGKNLEKCFRRVVRKSKLEKNDFSTYVNETLQRCTFNIKNESLKYENVGSKNESLKKGKVEQVRDKLLSLWEEHKNKLKMIEVVTGLQMSIESVAESLIVADRTCFLFENGVKDTRLVKLFDSSISPRGLVYLASKTIKHLKG